MTVEHRDKRGFSLIEIMAVIVILGFLSALIVPNLGTVRASQRKEAATSLAGAIEYARQRSIMTRKHHRVLLDVDSGSYRVEWWVSGDESTGQLAFRKRARYDLAGSTLLSLAPPLEDAVDYYPVPTRFGNNFTLDPDLRIAGVETPEGWLEDGEVALVFDTTGKTEPAEVVIIDSDETETFLEVLPLLPQVRIHHGRD